MPENTRDSFVAIVALAAAVDDDDDAPTVVTKSLLERRALRNGMSLELELALLEPKWR